MPIYIGNTPVAVYVGAAMPVAVYSGRVAIWRRDSAFHLYSAATTVTVPEYAAYVDVIALGGGGGGANGRVSAGTGGSAGQWAGQTVSVVPGEAVSVSIGKGGIGASPPAVANAAGGAGTASSVYVAGRVQVKGSGGAGGYGRPGQYGLSPGVCPYFNAPHDEQGLLIKGGAEAPPGTAGYPYGGGGGGGAGSLFPTTGANGAQGAVWLRFRSY